MRASIKERIEEVKKEYIRMIALYKGEMTEEDYKQVMNPFGKEDKK